MTSLRRRLAALALLAAAPLAAAAVLPSTAAPAQAAGAEAAVTAAPLTAPTMEAFVDSIPAVRAWTDTHADAARAVAPELLKSGGLASNPFLAAITALEGSPAHAALGQAVGRHGFQNPADWAGVANRVVKALGVLATQRDDPANPLAQAEQEVESNPHLSAEDRMKLKGLLMALTLFANAPQEDVQAVEPFSQDIVAALRAPL